MTQATVDTMSVGHLRQAKENKGNVKRLTRKEGPSRSTTAKDDESAKNPLPLLLRLDFT